ncbi:MAG: flagellar hook-length control protein FliK, partial [Bradyrhizobium sp.]
MAISINPILPVLAAQEAGAVAPELVLQPGSVVNAEVLNILSADLVRIAIASLSIDVRSEIPLQQGQALRLAVSQTKDGIRLAVVGQGADAAGLSGDVVTLSPEALVDAASNPPTITAAPKDGLTPLERAVVSVTVQSAATEQQSLAPLFANLGAVAASGDLPPKLQQAIAQVLAQQTSLDQNLDGGDIRNALQKSGLLFEARLASGAALPTAGVPDLKAALIVLRQTLQSSLGATPTTAAPLAASATPAPAAVPPATSAIPAAAAAAEETVLPRAATTPG